jgi:ABC-type glutathione transport system ATPase component
MRNEKIHLLKKLTLPDRFGNLYEEVGPEVTKLLVRPQSETMADLETASLSINARGEGLFIPLYGKSGRGKTTLARNLNTFLPSNYSPTVDYKGEIRLQRRNSIRGFKRGGRRSEGWAGS